MLAEREKKVPVWPAFVPLGFSLALLQAAGASCLYGSSRSALFACIVFQVLFVPGCLIFLHALFDRMVLRGSTKPGDAGAEGDTVPSRALAFAARALPLEIVCLVLALVIYLTGGYFELFDKVFAPAYCLYIVSGAFLLLACVVGMHRAFARTLAEVMRQPGADPADSDGPLDPPADGQG